MCSRTPFAPARRASRAPRPLAAPCSSLHHPPRSPAFLAAAPLLLPPHPAPVDAPRDQPAPCCCTCYVATAPVPRIADAVPPPATTARRCPAAVRGPTSSPRPAPTRPPPYPLATRLTSAPRLLLQPPAAAQLAAPAP
nr:lysine-rich arabinogalactan protein 19-like [Aegilops tauschii subsp. strangulata]